MGAAHVYSTAWWVKITNGTMLRPPCAKLYSAQTWIQLTASEAVNCDAVAVTGQPHWKEQTVSMSILKTSLEIIPSIVDPLIH